MQEHDNDLKIYQDLINFAANQVLPLDKKTKNESNSLSPNSFFSLTTRGFFDPSHDFNKKHTFVDVVRSFISKLQYFRFDYLYKKDKEWFWYKLPTIVIENDLTKDDATSINNNNSITIQALIYGKLKDKELHNVDNSNRLNDIEYRLGQLSKDLLGKFEQLEYKVYENSKIINAIEKFITCKIPINLEEDIKTLKTFVKECWGIKFESDKQEDKS